MLSKKCDLKGKVVTVYLGCDQNTRKGGPETMLYLGNKYAGLRLGEKKEKFVGVADDPKIAESSTK